MDKMQKLDEILKTYEEEMTETLRGLVRIPSVDGEPLPGKPFGEACARALDYALKKADVLVVTSDFPNPRVNHWRTLLTARAIENQMFVVACNRVGPSPMGTYCGHSIIIDPWGDIIAEGGGEEEIITGSIDYTKTREVRDLIHMFRDRQPTLYGDTLLRPVD